MSNEQSILVVDDSSTYRDIVAHELRQEGYLVSTARNGKKALDILKTEQFNFIITDLDMPEVDGYGLIKEIAGLSWRPGVILMTGHAEKALHSAEQLAIAYSINLLATLPKPIPVEKVLSALTDFVRSRSDEAGVSDSILSETEFMRGLMTDGLVPVYQPRVDAKTLKVTGVEVFARWRSISGGLMGAHSVLTLASEKGYMDVLTYRMLELAVEQCGEWLSQGIEMPISLNLNAENLRKSDFSDIVSGLLDQHNVPPEMVTLEVGEADMLIDERKLLEEMGRLHLRGLGLALDDFGTGFGSLMRLHKIPFSEIIIDRGFLDTALRDKVAFTILESVVDLAHKLDIKAASCGVSDAQTHALTKKLNFDTLQGYILGKPMLPNDFLSWLSTLNEGCVHLEPEG
ncbi:EAL domain-containing response regulator [Temperatibacter marinus]|uniref:EAL domain-containing response regulator n=1 Tax=Temperatibacter marinus TaxID=1456591 RepID=A0AA52EI94_9PROT|nr:EAL domain-containing response regulator [Temperatibacter marinus]WND02546.1 EAL domain-containing response regulator [Temperatibacter marinus]